MTENGSFNSRQFVDTQVEAIGLDLSPERRAAVAEVATVLNQMAKLVMEFPLDMQVVSAPVFKP
jgi:hypothetical protein